VSNSKLAQEAAILRLPSLEAQIVAWVDAVDDDLVHRNVHLHRRGFKAYVRRSRRLLDGRWAKTLDIASISISEKERGRGWFKHFRRIVEAVNPWDATYYEAVLNPRLEAYFRKEGLSNDGGGFYVMRVAHSPETAI
jgi:hypothetical protein